MWNFESENDQKLLRKSAANEASATILRFCGSMFTDYVPEEFKHAVEFLKACKEDFNQQIEEHIKAYQEKAEKKEV